MPTNDQKKLEERIAKIEKSIADISAVVRGEFKPLPEPMPEPELPPRKGPRPDPIPFVNSLMDISGKGLSRKLQVFAGSLTPEELEDLGVLFAPAIQAAQQAALKPVTRSHHVPADILRQLDLEVQNGEIFVGGQGPAFMTPTVTTVTITTTVASHPVIGCS